MNSNFGQKMFRPCKLHHHSQISRMVDCELCNECKRKNYAKVLHFQSERLKDDYIKLCKISTCMQYKNKTWMKHFFI